MNEMIDRFGRIHNYLRISVTDQCNLRCVYCMPEEGLDFLESEHVMSFEEIEAVVKTGASMGIRKLRITGGEPLIRKDIELLIAKLAAIPGIDDIAMTTNGILLEKKAEALKAAGLNRVNISLDTLDPSKFRMISRNGGLDKVIRGIEAAARAGFHPIKINCVLLKGINENEIAKFLELSLNEPLHVRFIEYMPIGHADENWKKHYLPLSRVMEIAEDQGHHFARINDLQGNGPSEDYQIQGAQGTFGLIHPVSNHFCERCNRLRLTADGSLKPCLYWVDELNVRPLIGDEEALKQLFMKALDIKPLNHEMAAKLADENQSHQPTDRRMSQIGG
ncbi:molybdenum cofactor biosynthesis protein MoeA [Paenibacillus swuensis]|uniref:GTP 3',8-cyclase n=1 Tax=Paenibacillus swuensis TaxID=1178515 RepID=A0A172TNZ0_9BACL|nr:GTP 3',8-cyclase MoaA [Paenibacillus swuensis]ANE48463.1 molybdenum cofactor biosynthesis protein MoeA [Paenibacillus swuensis]